MTDVTNPGSRTASMTDVSQFFDVNIKTVRRWMKEFDIPHTRIKGTIRFNLQEVAAWADAMTKDGAA